MPCCLIVYNLFHKRCCMSAVAALLMLGFTSANVSGNSAAMCLVMIPRIDSSLTHASRIRFNTTHSIEFWFMFPIHRVISSYIGGGRNFRWSSSSDRFSSLKELFVRSSLQHFFAAAIPLRWMPGSWEGLGIAQRSNRPQGMGWFESILVGCQMGGSVSTSFILMPIPVPSPPMWLSSQQGEWVAGSNDCNHNATPAVINLTQYLALKNPFVASVWVILVMKSAWVL